MSLKKPSVFEGSIAFASLACFGLYLFRIFSLNWAPWLAPFSFLGGLASSNWQGFDEVNQVRDRISYAAANFPISRTSLLLSPGSKRLDTYAEISRGISLIAKTNVRWCLGRLFHLDWRQKHSP